MQRGYCGIGIYACKFHGNHGGLIRAADALGADFYFAIGHKHGYSVQDTSKAHRNIPVFEYKSFAEFVKPTGAKLVAIEIDPSATVVNKFHHPEQAVYILGSEGTGVPPEILEVSDHVIEIPSRFCLNVAQAGAIVLYDRMSKQGAS